MITKEEIKKAASKYAKGNAPTVDQSFCAIDFRAGARWAIEQMQAENTSLRAALSSVVTDILDAARIVNDGKVPAYWKSTLEAAQAALNNTEK